MYQEMRVAAGGESSRKGSAFRMCIVAILMNVFLMVALSGCGSKSGQAGRVSESKESGSASGSDLMELAENQITGPLSKVGIVQVGHESDWRIEITRRCKELFTAEKGYELYFVDADNKPDIQVQAVRKFNQDEVDYIVIDPILPSGWTAVLKEAYQAKIPVFIIDRMVDCDSKYYQRWIGSDFEEEGRLAGQWLQNFLAGRGRGGEPIRIMTIQGTEGSSPQSGRSKGFAEYVGKNENWVMLVEESGDFTEKSGRDAMERLLQEYPDFQVAVCQNDNMAIGACQALEDAGKSYGRNGDICIISYDATKLGLQAVLDGKINFDLETDPRAVNYAAQAIHALKQGGTLAERTQYLYGRCFTGDNYLPMLKQKGQYKKIVKVTEELVASRKW